MQQAMHETPAQAGPAAAVSHDSGEVTVVLAQAARDHLESHPHHTLCPRATECKPCFILDTPFPRQIDVRPRRCGNCNRRKGQAATWRPRASDVLRMWPEVVHIQPVAKTKTNLYVTPLFLLTCLQLLYTHLNACAVRRVLVDVFAASALAGVRQGYIPDPTSWANAILALPQPEEIRCMALQGFVNFVDTAVMAMKKRQAIYNMAGIRGDAHYDLASRVRARNASTGYFETPYSAIQAWCGLDGSLLKPWQLCDGESFQTQASDLQPYLESGRDTRLAYGFTLAESRPVFHCTDSYNKHRNLWPSVYDTVWLGQTLQLQEGQRGNLTVGLAADVPQKAATLVTGDPLHDCINLRRALSHLSYDFADAYHDHEDIMNRLSAPPAPEVFPDAPGEIPQLSQAAREHLHDMLTLRVLTWRQKWVHRPEVTNELQRFLQQPHVLDHSVWTRMYRCHPPRGVGARLARRLDVSLHPTCGFWNFSSKKAFRLELTRQQKWYRQPKKLWRPTVQRRRRIMRAQWGPRMAVGPRSVLTQKVALHYKRLQNKTRTQGLWSWRKVALQLHEAGLPIHSGTVSVERLWATAQLCFPTSCRFIGKAWFEFLSLLAYLKINYSIFHRPSLPGWARTDAQLAEKVDTLFHVATQLVQCTEADTDVLPALAAAFQAKTEQAESAAAPAQPASVNVDTKPVSIHRQRGRNFPHALQQETAAASSTPLDAAASGSQIQEACTRKHTRGANETQTLQTPQVFKRMLRPLWNEALVTGQKFVEVQRYQDRRGNLMRGCTAGTFLVFGPTGFRLNQGPVHGFAEVAKVTLGLPAESLLDMLHLVAPHLRGDLSNYMGDAKYFDAVELRRVYDAREQSWTWQDLLRLLHVNSESPAAKQSQGFPALGGLATMASIRTLCERNSLPMLEQNSW